MLLAAALGLYLWQVQPQRSGSLMLDGLQAAVTVQFDEQGVPHIQAQNEPDLYRALGYLQASERLFQMELLRRLARGELAEILGPDLLPSDRLFRSLRLRQQAAERVAAARHDTPQWQAMQAYLDGINQFQNSRTLPPEFHLLGIKPHPFTAEDVVSVIGYMAYSFALALRTEPVLTHIRDNLGSRYLEIFEKPSLLQGPPPLKPDDWRAMQRLTAMAASTPGGLPQFEGSNAWAIAGSRTASGKPLLAGDPHIRFSLPQVWYPAHLSAPGFDLHGQYHALIPFALIGQTADHGWSLTMLQNDDMDLIAEPGVPPVSTRQEVIRIRGGGEESISLQDGRHGPWINSALGKLAGPTPLALRWGFYQPRSLILDAFYQLNHASNMPAARAAISGIDSPGLNVIWADAAGNIARWTAARLWQRPDGVVPHFILDGRNPEAVRPKVLPFSSNPHTENPVSGYVLSANQQVAPDMPGYYNLSDRYLQLHHALKTQAQGWDAAASQHLQQEVRIGYGPRLLAPLLKELRERVPAEELPLLEELAAWDGNHDLASRAAVLFNQLFYQLAVEAMSDELGPDFLDGLLNTRIIHVALPRLAANPQSAWWDDRHTAAQESRADILQRAWQASLTHLHIALGEDQTRWQWGRAHTLTFSHPLGRLPLLGSLLNAGPFPAPGTHETPNNLAQKLTTAPWAVQYGPSLRFTLDFGQPEQAQIIHPLGHSGIPFDRHYADQAADYLAGRYRPLLLTPDAVAAHSISTLQLLPASTP